MYNIHLEINELIMKTTLRNIQFGRRRGSSLMEVVVILSVTIAASLLLSNVEAKAADGKDPYNFLIRVEKVEINLHKYDINSNVISSSIDDAASAAC